MAKKLDLTEETTNVETPEIPNISAGDLQTVVRLIDAGSQRGAWRGEELAVIGELRTKFIQVLKAIAPESVTEATDTVEAEVEDEAPAADPAAEKGAA